MPGSGNNTLPAPLIRYVAGSESSMPSEGPPSPMNTRSFGASRSARMPVVRYDQPAARPSCTNQRLGSTSFGSSMSSNVPVPSSYSGTSVLPAPISMHTLSSVHSRPLWQSLVLSQAASIAAVPDFLQPFTPGGHSLAAHDVGVVAPGNAGSGCVRAATTGTSIGAAALPATPTIAPASSCASM